MLKSEEWGYKGSSISGQDAFLNAFEETASSMNYSFFDFDEEDIDMLIE